MSVLLRICVLFVLVMGLGLLGGPVLGTPAPPDEKGVLERFRVEKGGDDLLVPVALNGKRYNCLLDTGCSRIVFDPTLIFGEYQGPAIVGTPNGSTQLNLFDAPDATLGRFPLPKDDQVFGFNFKLMEASGQEVFGCVGMPFLRHHVLRIDFDAGEVVFLESVGNTPGQRFALSYGEGGLPQLRANLSGWGEEEFVLDTGYSGYSTGRLREDLFNTLRDKKRLKYLGESTSWSASGSSTDPFGRIEEISLGDYALQDTIVSSGTGNLLGLGFLARFVVTFDFPNNAVYLKKGKRFNRPEPRNLSGLHCLRKQRKTVVESVRKASAAEKGGFKSGDILVTIDDMNADKVTLFKLYQLLGVTGKKYRVVVRRGEEEMELTLALRD